MAEGGKVSETRPSSLQAGSTFDLQGSALNVDASNKITYFRVALVGDAGSEKDHVRRAYVQLSSNLTNQIKADQVPKGTFEKIDVLDANVVTVQGVQLELLTAERIADFERIPTMVRCSHLDAIILFYNINSLKQFESIHQKWVPTIRRLYRNTPFVICATGIEAHQTTKSPYQPRHEQIRSQTKDPNVYQNLITAKVGQSLATELKAAAYAEVSTKTFEGIEDLFTEVLAAIITSQQSKVCLTRNRVGRPRPKDACILM
ncbi:unnamed protein product [Toxocara canis]|uniref:Ras-like protein family member 11A n=1 Tax=Toxocara canis TaxID=6265 RepID=A0A183UMA3_TOXCA|nr:unnamed protein product [Toxocara canis]